MKKTLLLFAFILLTGMVANAQAPQKFNYQGIVRNSLGAPLATSTLTMRLTIHDGSATGPVDYQETQTVLTNAYGLYNVAVGDGTPTALGGTFAAIPWALGDKYLQIEIDPAAGTSYTTVGTSQLLSVPFALNGPSGPAGPAGPTGATGATGPAGANGVDGATGPAGPAGPAGPTGATGATGPAGPTGTTGATGPAGPIGPAGPTGATGPIGPMGATGATGPAGPAGPTGPQGPAGLDGTGAGTVTNITVGVGLGGPTNITSTGTIDLPNIGTSGTYGDATHYPAVTTDAYGRVTGATLYTLPAATTSVTMGGDVTGNSATATVAKIQGTSVSGAAPTIGQVLEYNGLVWLPSSLPAAVTSLTMGGDVTGTTAASTVSKIRGTNVVATAPTTGQSLVFDGTNWAPTTVTASGDNWGTQSVVTNSSLAGNGTSGSPLGISPGTAYHLSAYNATGNALTNSPMFMNPAGTQIGIGDVVATTLATIDAESTTDTMIALFTTQTTNPTPNGVLAVGYNGSDLTTNSVAIKGESVPSDVTAVGWGVYGLGGNIGVYGRGISQDVSSGSFTVGVEGDSYSSADNSYGVAGIASGDGSGPLTNYGIYGGTDGTAITNYAGYFNGDVQVTGNFSVAGTKSFKMDHPLDPENKYLYHSCVESPDQMNIYNGNVTTDAGGVATVMLPDYFEALNKDFRYQLTVIGTFAQAIVSKEVSGNTFEIKTNQPNVKVSWQVTGVRHDAAASAHPMQVTVEKESFNKGKYLSPEAFGKDKTLQIGYYSHPKAAGRGKTSIKPAQKRK